MTEIDQITESPEYKNSKYSQMKKKTIAQKYQADNEVDEYNIFDSPQMNNSVDKLQKRGLIVNASGSKKSINAFNRTNENLAHKLRVFNKPIYDVRVDVSNEGRVNKSLNKDTPSSYANHKIKPFRKKQQVTSSMNFSHKIDLTKSSNHTQRLHTDLLALSPSKKGVNMIPIESKQSETPDSVDRENTGDEVHADILPDFRRKKKNRNIARDFNTNGDIHAVNRKITYEGISNRLDQIQSPFKSPHRATIPINIGKKESFANTPFDINFSSDNDEYESDEKFTFRKPQMLSIDERKSFPDGFDFAGVSKKKNTPLKSISTKTKESLSTFHKESTPNKSFGNPPNVNYDTILNRKKFYPLHKQDSPTVVT